MTSSFIRVAALLAVISFQQNASAVVCSGTLGPNVLGSQGTFSAPFITPENNLGSNCVRSGNNSYSPLNNLGTALPGAFQTYPWTGSSGGLQPEARYSILKTIGDANGGNCIKGDWRGQDHTNDGGWFMAVNGAPNAGTPARFYKISNVKVCKNTTYQFSAYVSNMLPLTNLPPNNVGVSEPNVSFKVDNTIVGYSGPVPYTATPTWNHVGGNYLTGPNQDTLDLEVSNATQVAFGNDLGLDDISLRACGSLVDVVTTNTSFCPNSALNLQATVTDANGNFTYYKWQESSDGINFTDVLPAVTGQGVFNGGSYTVNYTPGLLGQGSVVPGHYYRLVVAADLQSLEDDGCVNYNQYMVQNLDNCNPLPITLDHFYAVSNNCVTELSWDVSNATNFSHFNVQKSVKGGAFAELANVNYSKDKAHYAYQDKGATSNDETLLYRLSMVDIDGSVRYSPTQQVRINCEKKLAVKMYPNPVVNEFHVNFTDLPVDGTAYTIMIRSINGKLIGMESFNADGAFKNFTYNLSSYPTGQYVVTISGGSIQQSNTILIAH